MNKGQIANPAENSAAETLGDGSVGKTESVEEIALGLTKAQRQVILRQFNPNLIEGRLSRLWKNLRKRGLSDGPFMGLNATGLAVRAYLEQTNEG